MSEILLSICNVSFHYPGQQPLLKNISLEVKKGELITLLGANGYGKSTLLECIMGFHNPKEGVIYLKNKPIQKQTSRSIAKSIAYVAQTNHIRFQHLVRDYIAMGRAPYLNMFQKPDEKDYLEVDRVMEKLGITHLANKVFTKLSGGERQMVDICKAMIQKPEIILFDEPTAALDYGNQIKLLKVVKELSQKGYTIIMTTHNPEHPLLLQGSVCILSRDGNLRKGTVEESITEQQMNELYNCNLRIRYHDDVERLVCMINHI